ncbi:MAG TPA: carbohydrate kinase family protein [Terriglobia bacterium]|nr:carbohydrate kinase family protein [Terriglobia bacterium]
MAQFDVTVAGELNLDLILYGLPDELEPEKELLADNLALTLGSSSAIFAHNLAVIGNSVGFISRIGADALGKIALERLAFGGVDVSRVRSVPGATKTGLTVIATGTSNRRILTYPGAMFEMGYDDLDLDYLRSGKHFHLSSFYLHRALRPRIAELFQRMKRAGLSTSLDTNDDPDDRWDGLEQVLPQVDVLFVNEREAGKITGEENLETAVERLAGRVQVVAIKLGSKGARVRRGSEEWTHAGYAVNAVDPVGAGDSFDAGFLDQYVRGAELEDCLAGGNLAGAFSTTQPGGTEAFREPANWRQFLQEHRNEAAA